MKHKLTEQTNEQPKIWHWQPAWVIRPVQCSTWTVCLIQTKDVSSAAEVKNRPAVWKQTEQNDRHCTWALEECAVWLWCSDDIEWMTEEIWELFVVTGVDSAQFGKQPMKIKAKLKNKCLSYVHKFILKSHTNQWSIHESTHHWSFVKIWMYSNYCLIFPQRQQYNEHCSLKSLSQCFLLLLHGSYVKIQH